MAGGNDDATNNNNDDEGVLLQDAVSMKLLDVRLQPSAAILTSVIGAFTGSDDPNQILCLQPNGILSLYALQKNNDKLKLVTMVETHSVLRNLCKLRTAGSTHDVAVITSDSGCLSLLDFASSTKNNNTPTIVQCVEFGKTGCRRSVPGQYCSVDPTGRAILIGSVEKSKLIYSVHDDHQKLVLSSPLEGHRSRNLVYATQGLDTGHGNPIFAVLEVQYPEVEASTVSSSTTAPPQKQVGYYELDLGLNHVSRKWATNCLNSAICLAAVPGGAHGPGGCLVGGQDYIEYVHNTAKTSVSCAIPRRAFHPQQKGILVTHICLHKQRKSKFFCLASTELGDVYKVTLQVDKETNTVQGMTVALLDTLPACNSLNISDLGLLFCASEFGDHHLYQFVNIDLPNAPCCDSASTIKAIDGDRSKLTTETAQAIAPTFVPTVLQNLRKIYTLDNPSPTTGLLVGELAGNEVSPQIYKLTGRGPHSALRILRHGASVTELAVSELPGIPGGIFTVGADRLDKYIVVSFADATLVLSVGESVEEVGKESGFLTNTPTLACSALGSEGAMCQVHPSGVRHIKKTQTTQWHCPGLKRIETATTNEGQVLIALAGGEIIYFELDTMSGNLTEAATREMGADVCSLDVGTIPKGSKRCMFAAVGCRDQTVRIVSLEPGNLLTQKSSTALKSRPHSVSLQADSEDELTLVIGLDDGSSLRASVDPVTGTIGSSPTRRFLGARPVAVSRISLESQSAALLLSSRPWISRRDENSGKHVMAPLSFAPLDHGCSFQSEAVPEGIIATAGKTLRILSVESSGLGGGDNEAFNTNKVELRYTPRQMALMSASPGSGGQRRVALVVVESDYNEYGWEEKKAMGFDPTGEGSSSADAVKKEEDAMDVDSDDEGAKENDGDEDDDEEKDAKKTPIRGPVPPTSGHWGSCIRLLDPANNCESLDCIEMGKNEAALCCASVRFHSKGGEPLLAVGTVTGMTMHPLKQTASHIVLFRIINGDRFQLLHRTAVEDGPVMALAHFQGRLLVGIGKCLRLYEMGKRQLLRKCEIRNLPSFVKTIKTIGDRAYVGDLLQSLQIVRYDVGVNRLVWMAGDAHPRPLVSVELLDWNTAAVGDKFGNISIMRLPKGAEASAVDLSGQRALWDSARDDSRAKLDLLCQYYVGEVVTSMTRSSLVAGGPESIIYVTVSGRIGALVPLQSRDQVEFYNKLESELRNELPRPTGRDPRKYRSYYAPVMHVVDGDLCLAFNSLPHKQQEQIADTLELTIAEVMKKLEDTRNSLL